MRWRLPPFDGHRAPTQRTGTGESILIKTLLEISVNNDDAHKRILHAIFHQRTRKNLWKLRIRCPLYKDGRATNTADETFNAVDGLK